MTKTLGLICCFFLLGCSNVTPPEIRAQQAAQLAQSSKWHGQTISSSYFSLKAFGPLAPKSSRTLTIYIEGDGLAWLSSDRPSDNPTPLAFTGLKMALHDHSHQSIAYLARPCQFVFKAEWRNRRSAYWTQLRYSAPVLEAMNQGVEYLKKRYHARQLILIGYSGGGTIATLLAAKRKDILKLITVAAVLDTRAWEKQGNLTPLKGSLNPADFWPQLMSVAQTHWLGEQDHVVPKEVAFSFAHRFPRGHQPRIIVIPHFNHTCCWATEWTPS